VCAAKGSAGGSTKKRAGEAAALTIPFSTPGAATGGLPKSRVAAPKARQTTAIPNTLRQTPFNNISICRPSSSRHLESTAEAKT